MNTRMKAVYGRQSVDRRDSISIESQIEFCQYELKGEHYRAYTDKGFSGKNTDRPQFQALIRDIEQGLISTVIVYKLDRISRSIIDFANMMELLQRYNVEFVSATEKFDTSTPIGRAMLNICIVFAQLERETIQKRVQDAFHSRCRKGFFMSGKAPYGYTLEPTTLGGIRTKKMVTNPVAADHVRLMYYRPTLLFMSSSKANPKLTARTVELAQVNAEIETLLDNLTGANAILLSYANSKVEALGAKRQALMKEIADMQAAALSPGHAKSISGHLGSWDDVSFEDKRTVTDGLIAKIQATSEGIKSTWKV